MKTVMRAIGASGVCVALLAGCGEFKVKELWPFGKEAAQERPRGPANATEYQCAAGKRFHVRMLEGGAAAWLILPEREVRLDRLGSEGTRFGNGKAVLEISGNEATLKDGPAISLTGCKAAAS